MPRGMPEQPDHIELLKDAARNSAFQRGAKEPGWADVWMGLASISAFREVLQQRGVNTGGFAADASFLLRIGSKDPEVAARLEATAVSEKLDINAVRDDLLNKLRKIDDELMAWPDDRQRSKYMIFMTEIMSRVRGLDMSQDPEKIRLQEMIMEQALKKALVGPNAAIGVEGMPPILIRDIIQDLTNFILMDWTENAKEKNNILERLDAFKISPIEVASPVEVVESLRAQSGGIYNELLYRNGYLSDDAELQDALAGQIPDEFVRNLALGALGEAYESHAKTVQTNHLVHALLEDYNIKRHLSKLGLRDLVDFHDKFFGALDKDAPKEGKIRIHPAVTQDFRDSIWKLDELVKDMPEAKRGPVILKFLNDSDEQVAAALKAAGLDDKMLQEWDSAYAADDKNEGDKKKKKEFKFSDADLEEMIGQFCIDYTKLAGDKKFDPMIGQKDVMEKVTTTLLKRGKKNPLVIGDPGIGKSKVLEGYAQAIVAGEVPQKLIGSRLLYLDLHQMNNSPYVSVFETQLKGLLDAVSERNASGEFPPIQIAIDELAGQQDAGGHSHSEGAKAILKPYLTRGDLFVIANTTRDEYQKKVQGDPALARRFNVIGMNAPTDAETFEILKQLKPTYAAHHGLEVSDDLLKDIAFMTGRYVQGNQPDKSIDAFDHACAMAVMAGATAMGKAQVVRAISSASGMPEDYLGQNDKERYRVLPQTLKGEVLQQDAAVDAVCAPLQRAQFGLKDPNKPLGNFLFIGPTGVGKTELCKALARHLFGGEEFMNRFDMSEYMEKHSTARFIGAPPGYVGFEEGGGLVNKVNSHPFCVNLFDEVEKAHADVLNTLLGPLGDGHVEDGRGRRADMRNTINIMTSNLGAEAVQKEGERLHLDPVKDHEAWQKMAKPIYARAVQQFFKPELLNRLDGVIYFDGLNAATITLLTDRRLDQTKKQLEENNGGLTISLSDTFRQAVADAGFDIRYGARPLKRAVETLLENPLAAFLLEKGDAVGKAKQVKVSVANDNRDKKDPVRAHFVLK